MKLKLKCCFTSTETVGLIREGSPGRLSQHKGKSHSMLMDRREWYQAPVPVLPWQQDSYSQTFSADQWSRETISYDHKRVFQVSSCGTDVTRPVLETADRQGLDFDFRKNCGIRFVQ